MTTGDYITSIRFKNYKAFAEYSVSLKGFNVLVGPNNAGKSTILGALRILAEGVRKARARNAEFVNGPDGSTFGYSIDLRGLPVSTENVFHNYNESEPALILFRLSGGNTLTLFFPGQGVCCLVPTAKKYVRTVTDFKREFPLRIAFVPVLGPVEHIERLYQPEAARRALLSHNASRNFRNIWYHSPDGFDIFRETIRSTWPGMDIQRPEVIPDEDKPFLAMFCPEERFPRELFWAGFGFQVWCQMLTFILQAKELSLLVIDEPDIYLHSDLQRQLVSILRDLGPAIVLATHSTEIISEVETEALLNVNKRFRSARRITNTHELQNVFSTLGSNLNPTLTQLAKTKRVVFVEGKDFQIFSRFARKLAVESVANRSHFGVVPVEGFNPQKVKDFASGMELTLGTKLVKVVVFDRDYRSQAETDDITASLTKFCWYATILERKEIENYLLQPAALSRAIRRKLDERGLPTPPDLSAQNLPQVLMDLSDPHKNKVQAQLVTARQRFEKQQHPGHHASNVSHAAMDEFDQRWASFEERMKIAPGKEMLSIFNGYLQTKYGCALTPGSIVDAFQRSDVWPEIVSLISKLEEAQGVNLGDADE